MSSVLRRRCFKREVAGSDLWSSSLACLPNASMSWLVLLGLIDLTSSGPTFQSTGPTSEESLGTIMVPLLRRLGRLGRTGIGAWMGWSTDDAPDESDRAIVGIWFGLSSSMVDNTTGGRR